MTDATLVKLTQAERLLAEVSTATEAANVIDLAEAARVFAQRARLGTAAINHATTVKLKAEIKLAELVDKGQESGQIATVNDGGRPPKLVRPADALKVKPKTLDDLGISKQRVAEARTIRATYTPEKIEAIAAEASAQDREISRKGLIREARRAEATERVQTIAATNAARMDGLYDALVIDPPWPMQKIERDERPNQVAFDYPTMTEEEMAALELPLAKDAHVWVWTTHKFLPMGLRLLDAWGLKYVCTFVWHKPGGFQPIGLPQYNAEFALYARKGSPKFVDTKAFPTCFNAPRGAHSEKPSEFYDVVRRVTGGRRLDMFNRRPIEGFDTWGNEAQ